MGKSNGMDVQIKGNKKGNKMIITVDLKKPVVSNSGKTMLVYSSHGNQETCAKVDGKNVTIGINAWYKP